MSFIAETERLGMRPYHPDDAEAFLALCSDPEVMRYIPGEATPNTLDAMRQMLADYPDYEKHGFGRWSCILKESGRFIGFTGLKLLEDFDGEVDLGYRFFREFWGRGIATEAGLESLRYGFEVLDLQRIIGITLPENIASRRVLAKCGMSFERFTNFDGHEVAVYAVEKQAD